MRAVIGGKYISAVDRALHLDFIFSVKRSDAMPEATKPEQKTASLAKEEKIEDWAALRRDFLTKTLAPLRDEIRNLEARRAKQKI